MIFVNDLDQNTSFLPKLPVILIEKSLAMPGEDCSPEGEPEDAVEDLDIDSLLQANLGAVNITDILNLSGSDNNLLPTDLPDMSMLEEAEAESEKVKGIQ